ncbi:MAG TPA: hypothetical protein ENK04_04315 [Gammaproteobacteria bacterium]|nr:hypothetical protein [Gammaproteobacteria bacterium]
MMLTHKPNLPASQHQSGGISKNAVITLFIIFAFAIIAWTILPSSFSTDLDLIGQGKPAVVLIYDMENGNSLDLMKGYNAIRHDYEHLVEFLIADVASPKGNTFIRTHKATPGSAIYYSDDGEEMRVLYGSQDEKTLSDSIKNTFGL